ncbi:MAG TPA: hypothetical protein VHX43_16775 [Xanthobacteraceae bacterium]|nr:hypothetical protein [Xanthobacteraceae bacterium]
MMALAGHSVATRFEWREIEIVKAEIRKITMTGDAIWDSGRRFGNASRSPGMAGAFGCN